MNTLEALQHLASVAGLTNSMSQTGLYEVSDDVLFAGADQINAAAVDSMEEALAGIDAGE